MKWLAISIVWLLFWGCAFTCLYCGKDTPFQGDWAGSLIVTTLAMVMVGMICFLIWLLIIDPIKQARREKA